MSLSRVVLHLSTRHAPAARGSQAPQRPAAPEPTPVPGSTDTEPAHVHTAPHDDYPYDPEANICVGCPGCFTGGRCIDDPDDDDGWDEDHMALPRVVRRGQLAENGPMEGEAARRLPASSTAFVAHAPPDMDPGPTDTPHRDTDQRWHASEAEALAKLADLTATRSPWAAAHDMTWSAT